MRVKTKDLAAAANVSASVITNNWKRGNLIRGENKIFDLEEPMNHDWCMRKNINPKTCKKQSNSNKTLSKKVQPKKKSVKKQNKKEPDEYINDQSDFGALTGLPDRMLVMTLRELVMKFGGPMQLKGWVDILDKLMSAQKKDVEIQEKRKKLVPRDLVEFLKNYVDVFTNQVFDNSDGLVRDIIALANADKKNAKAKGSALLKKNISKFAKETTRRIDNEIKNLKVQDDNAE